MFFKAENLKHNIVNVFRKDALSKNKVKLNSSVSFPLFLLPHRYRGLSGGRNAPGHLTFTRALETHKTKRHTTSRANN